MLCHHIFVCICTSQIILGNVVSRPAKLDPRVARKLVAAGEGKDEYLTVLGKTISTDDFYEGQVVFTLGLYHACSLTQTTDKDQWELSVVAA